MRFWLVGVWNGFQSSKSSGESIICPCCGEQDGDGHSSGSAHFLSLVQPFQNTPRIVRVLCSEPNCVASVSSLAWLASWFFFWSHGWCPLGEVGLSGCVYSLRGGAIWLLVGPDLAHLRAFLRNVVSITRDQVCFLPSNLFQERLSLENVFSALPWFAWLKPYL